MSDLTEEQFRNAVAAAISGVEHLYREVDLLIAGLREALAEEPEPLTLKRGTLGKSGKAESKRVVVRHEYGALFEPAADEDDEGDDDEDEEPEDADAKPSRQKGRARHEVAAGQPLLAVRIAMYDPRKRAAFHPQIEFAVMSDWSLGESPNQPGDRFILQSYMLKRIPRALADRAGIGNGTRIATRAAARRADGGHKGEDRRLNCRLPRGVETVSLYSVNSAEALEKLAERMKAMWGSVIEA